MTKMLFYQNPYTREYQTKVLQVKGNKVLLEETIFFPQASTEPGDTGKINDRKVVEVEREKDKIWHILEKVPDFKEGETVNLQIDWEKRYKMMRLHSGLHLLAGAFELLFRQRAVAGMVKADSAFLVFKQPVEDYIQDSLGQANDDIQDGLEIKTYEDEKGKGFRWCKVGDYSPIPCGGVHVKNTKEIGKLFLIKKTIEDGRQKLTVGVE